MDKVSYILGEVLAQDVISGVLNWLHINTIFDHMLYTTLGIQLTFSLTVN